LDTAGKISRAIGRYQPRFAAITWSTSFWTGGQTSRTWSTRIFSLWRKRPRSGSADTL
jgi:hypothetical protein